LTPEHRLLQTCLLFVCIAITPQGAVATSEVDNKSSPSDEVRLESIEQLAAKAANAFRAGQFEEALTNYRRTIALVTRQQDEATLRLNIGACLIELGRLNEAKTEFLRAADLDPTVAKKARLNAALVAVELDRVDEAQSLLDAASPVDEALISREQDIKRRIEEKRSSAQRGALLAQLATAAAAIARSDWVAAESALLASRKLFEWAEPSERVDILHSLGTVQLALERPRDAKVTLTSASALAPNDPEIHYALGRADQALDETSEARTEYRKALELGLKEPQAKAAKDRVEALGPLGPSEWFGWLSLVGGYDSNPRQSGVATETTLGRRGRGGSGYGRVAAELGRTQRISDQFNLRARYAGEWLGLEKRLVRDLSLQNHGVFGSAQWAPTDRLTLGLEIGPSITYIGLSPISQFTWDVVGAAKARFRASDVRTWRLSFDVRQITGLSGWEFLGGTRLDGELSHGWSYRAGSFRLGLRGRHLSIGTRTTTVDATFMPACTGLCDGAEYFIPLSYSGFGPIASTRVEIVSSLHLVGMTQLDWRRYRDESYISAIAQSRKRRQDLRWSAGVDLQWALDEDEHLLIVPSYAVLLSSSNVAQSSSDPQHAFDYDDRSFTQHFVEVGVELSF
jgi:Flp pilus assembly protein TadD